MVEEGTTKGVAEDAVKEGAVEGAVKLVSGYLVIIPGFKVYINNTTRFRAVLIVEALLAAL